jgi:hypothetical protein
MKKALIIALAGVALIASGLSIAETSSNPYQSTVVSAQTQNVAQKHHKSKKCKKGMKSMKSSKHRQKKQ